MARSRKHRQSDPYRVLVAARDATDLRLLRLGCALARAHAGEVHLITVTRGGAAPSWLKIPDTCQDVTVHMSVRPGKNVSAIILQTAQEINPDLLILGWRGQHSHGRYLMGRTLDPVIQSAACNILVTRDPCKAEILRVLIPIAGGPNAPQAFEIASALAPQAEITALYVAPDHLGKAGILVGQERLDTLVQPLSHPDHIRKHTVHAPNPIEGILEESKKGYDLVLLGAASENIVGRFLFTPIPQAILMKAPIPVMVVRRRLTYLRSFTRRFWVRIFGLLPILTIQEQAQVYKTVRRGSRTSADFSVMITIAAAIAALGLLLNSPAVIIGAMLVAPLMTAILGMGLSIVMGDMRSFWTALNTTLRGSVLATITGAMVALIVPSATVTQELLNRGNPTLLDLGIALGSGIAAAYALSRRDVSAALVGVAIAAALAPPLTTIGISLVLGQWWLAGNALLLFLTNIVSIVAAGGLTFFILGFRPAPGQPGGFRILRQGAQGIALLLLLVFILLTLLTRQSFQESQLNAAVEAALQLETQRIAGVELVDWTLLDEKNDKDETLQLDVTVRVPQAMSYQEARDLQERVAAHLERPVALSLEMVPSTSLQAYTPPTPTPTGEPTALPAETAAPSPTATTTPIPTATAAPTATPWMLTVQDVGNGGLMVYYAPDGMMIGQLEEGSVIEILEGPLLIKEQFWCRILSAENRLEGWVLTADLEAWTASAVP